MLFALIQYISVSSNTPYENTYTIYSWQIVTFVTLVLHFCCIPVLAAHTGCLILDIDKTSVKNANSVVKGFDR